MNNTRHNKGITFPPEPLTRDETLALMKACSRRAPTGIRDRALICLLWRGQLRISEALALKAADFDASACTLRVLRGKGKKSRVVVIDQTSG
jgi:integrase/recombinase XerD